MRRPLGTSALVLGLAASLLGGVGATAQADAHHSDRTHALPSRPTPAQALQRAREALADRAAGTPAAERSATLALRDLFAARPRLTGADRTQAERILARPSARKKACNTHVCVHWSTSGPNRATNAWAKKTLRYMGTVWSKEVGKLGYRAPLKDGRHGGNSKLDVYLKNLGSQGVYGYCAPEYRGRKPRTASGFCALDNNFSRAEFGIRPVDALHVTAAHEFFHAVQFAYDYLEDAWIMEATSTWMEEQVADDVDDNRQYLPYGQLGTPSLSLDFFDREGVGQYGQWLYFQYLQQVHGTKIVRKIWSHLPGRADYSVKVLESAVGGSFAQQYAGFVAANLLPGSFYAEGKRYAQPYPDGSALNAGQSTGGSTTLNHLTSLGGHVIPGAGLEDSTWNLRVTMDGPDEVTAPMLVVVWKGLDGKVRRYVVDTDTSGAATQVVKFSSTNTQDVYFALVDAGDRYSCSQGTDYACAGVSKDDSQPFAVTLQTVQG